MKRDLRVVLRIIILLLLACFAVSQNSPLVAQASPDGKDENKTKDENKAKEDVKTRYSGIADQARRNRAHGCGPGAGERDS